jgi:predicted ribosomally synthesized peptide with SipW-like signal peptide
MNTRHPHAALFAVTAALLLSTFASFSAQEQAAPAIELGSPFRDNAILQQQRELPV